MTVFCSWKTFYVSFHIFTFFPTQANLVISYFHFVTESHEKVRKVSDLTRITELIRAWGCLPMQRNSVTRNQSQAFRNNCGILVIDSALGQCPRVPSENLQQNDQRYSIIIPSGLNFFCGLQFLVHICRFIHLGIWRT